jgi:hypothetical protein
MGARGIALETLQTAAPRPVFGDGSAGGARASCRQPPFCSICEVPLRSKLPFLPRLICSTCCPFVVGLPSFGDVDCPKSPFTPPASSPVSGASRGASAWSWQRLHDQGRHLLSADREEAPARPADLVAIRIGRANSPGRPIVWLPQPELMPGDGWGVSGERLTCRPRDHNAIHGRRSRNIERHAALTAQNGEHPTPSPPRSRGFPFRGAAAPIVCGASHFSSGKGPAIPPGGPLMSPPAPAGKFSAAAPGTAPEGSARTNRLFRSKLHWPLRSLELSSRGL